MTFILCSASTGTPLARLDSRRCQHCHSQLERPLGAFSAGDNFMRDLDHWHAFETARPDTFAGMYQFWIQKD
jgi:hypothetical protein